MPAIWTFGPTNVTGIDLGANAFWRLALGGMTASNMPWLSVSLIYPPSTGQTIQQTQIALARIALTVTTSIEDVLKLAEISVSMGSLEKDRERMTEGFNLFKNGRNVRQEILESDLKAALDILDTYWKIRTWLFEGAREAQDIAVASYNIKLMP